MQVTIDENSGGAPGEVEKFDEVKLETDEICRFMIPVPGAEAHYVHELKPILIVNGVVQMETKHRKDKSEYKVPATGFLGRRICLGRVGTEEDPGPMRLRGLDPEACIVCAAVADGIVDLKAELRYALPIIRITTRGKTSTDIQDPPSAKILVLGLTWRQYRDLTQNLKGIRELYGWGPEVAVKPSMADLVIKCEDAGFKRYQWLTPMRPHWGKEPGTDQIRNPALRAAIFGLWRNPDNRPTPEQLQAACGRMTDIIFLQTDLETVVESYALQKAIERGEKMGSAPQHPAESAQAGGLDAGLDDIDEILGTDAPAPAAPAGELDGLGEFTAEGQSGGPAATNGHAKAAAAASGADEDLFGEEAAPAAPAEPPAAAQAAPAAAKAGGDAASFDDLWEGL